MIKKRKIPVKLIIVIVLVVAAWFYLFGDSIKLPQRKQKGLTNPDYFSEEECKKQLSAEQSDIDGMTKYDKFEEGLNTDDGADSDWDGLTDKEEIEKYHTDPKKVSTSGDLYSDGYKVAHNMDLTKKYDYKNDLTFENNSCPEVVLTAEKARDFNCFVNDLTDSGMYNLPDKEVIKEYSVSLFSGTFAVDLSMIENVPSMDDVKVYVQADGDDEAKYVKFDDDGMVITLNKKFEYGQHYVIYLTQNEKVKVGISHPVEDVKKNISNSIANSKFGRLVGMDSKATVTYGKVSADGVVRKDRAFGVVEGNQLDPDSVWIYYLETDDEALKQEVIDNLTYVADSICLETWAINDKQHFNPEHVKALSYEEMKEKVDSELAINEFKETENGQHLGTNMCYYIYDAEGTGLDETGTDDIISANANSGDDSGNGDKAMYSIEYADRIPFENFATEMSPNGVCAGIAHLTTMVHNRGTVLDPVKNFTFKDKNYSYDITKDPDNQTLMNIGLHDYKDAHFVETHKDRKGLVTENLTDGEQAFVNMVNYYWAKQNSVAGDPKYFKGRDVSDDDDLTTKLYYDGTVVRNTINELNNGNYVDANFILDDGSGHAVTITGYTKVKSNAEGYIFYVYDSNYPTKTGTVTCLINKMKVGDGEYLDYAFKVPGANYAAYSSTGVYGNKTGERIAAFIAVDTDFNVLN